jgi:hypothetical protein
MECNDHSFESRGEKRIPDPRILFYPRILNVFLSQIYQTHKQQNHPNFVDGINQGFQKFNIHLTSNLSPFIPVYGRNSF